MARPTSTPMPQAYRAPFEATSSSDAILMNSDFRGWLICIPRIHRPRPATSPAVPPAPKARPRRPSAAAAKGPPQCGDPIDRIRRIDARIASIFDPLHRQAAFLQIILHAALAGEMSRADRDEHRPRLIHPRLELIGPARVAVPEQGLGEFGGRRQADRKSVV